MSPRRSVEDLLDALGDVPLQLVYIAGNVEEAHQAERILDERRIEFAVSLELFRKTFSLALGSQYHGVFFYVPAFQHQMAREVLEGHGLRDTVE